MIAAARHGEQIDGSCFGAAVAFPEPGRATFRALAEGRAKAWPQSPMRQSHMLNVDFVAAHPDIAAGAGGVPGSSRRSAWRRPDHFRRSICPAIERVRNPVLVGERTAQHHPRPAN
jgi:hypothetical protein